jgi:hypothetical protein
LDERAYRSIITFFRLKSMEKTTIEYKDLCLLIQDCPLACFMIHQSQMDHSHPVFEQHLSNYADLCLEVEGDLLENDSVQAFLKYFHLSIAQTTNTIQVLIKYLDNNRFLLGLKSSNVLFLCLLEQTVLMSIEDGLSKVLERSNGTFESYQTVSLPWETCWISPTQHSHFSIELAQDLYKLFGLSCLESIFSNCLKTNFSSNAKLRSFLSLAFVHMLDLDLKKALKMVTGSKLMERG